MRENKKCLPQGWVEVCLFEVSDLIFGQSPPSTTYNEEKKGLPFFQGKAEFGPVSPVAVKWCSKPTRIAKEHDILISIRAPVGPTNLASEECAIGRGLAAIRPIIVNRPYIQYFLMLTQNDLASKGTGTTFKAITKDVLKNHQIRVAPLNEQKRIVDKIKLLFSDLNEGEALLKTVQEQLATYRQSVLKAAVTGELIKGVADEWTQYNVGQLLTDIRYGTAKKCTIDPAKTPVLRIPNIVGGKIDLSNLKYTDFTEAELNKLRLKTDDILLVRSNGSVSLVGLSAVVTDDAAGYAYAGYLIRLRPKRDIILPEFLNLYLHSPIARSRIELHARSTSGVHNINSDEVKSITLKVPSITEQKEIIDKVDGILSQIDTLENWCQTELKRSFTMRQSILKAAFSGKLLPQDPSDEPASELLKRIQASRATIRSPRRLKHKKPGIEI